MGYLVNKYDAKTTGKESITDQSEYSGNPGKIVQNTMGRTNFQNAETRSDKENISIRTRSSGPQKFQIASGKVSYGAAKIKDNMLLKEESDKRSRAPIFSQLINSKKSMGQTTDTRKNDQQVNRLYPELISSQLDKNPFTIQILKK